MRKWPAQVSTVVANVGRELSLLKMVINMANADYLSFFLWNELEPRCQQRAAGSLELGFVLTQYLYIHTARFVPVSPFLWFAFTTGYRAQSLTVHTYRTQSPPIICHAPTASRREATRSYPTRWRPRLGENGKCWISKFSLNNITQILLHIKDYNIWNSFSLTDMRLLPQK